MVFRKIEALKDNLCICIDFQKFIYEWIFLIHLHFLNLDIINFLEKWHISENMKKSIIWQNQIIKEKYVLLS